MRDLLSKPMTAIGEKYGVSDTAVKKWCKKYGLPASRVEIKALRESRVE